MAMSLSHPDPSSSTSIADASFGTARRGFDQTEVRDFLRRVAAEFGRLEERQRFLEREVEAARSGPDTQLSELDEEALTRLLGEESIRLLTTARASGAEIRQKAEAAASRLLADASIEAARVREEADVDASRRRTDANADAEAELQMAKQQGREMVEEAQAYRERVLAELARRRELAREQIEQLVQGRDRLLQAFERARLVAVDVVTELQPLGEPDEYVNLEPTTGPVPVMIANSARPYDGHDEVGDSPIPEALGDLRIVADEVDESENVGDVDEIVTDEIEEIVTESIDGSDEIVPDDDAVEATVEVQAVDEVDASTTEDESVAEAVEELVESEVAPLVETVEVDVAETPGGDVVVDLFARLRADADAVIDTADTDVDDDLEVAAEIDTERTDDTNAELDDETESIEPSVFADRDAALEPLIAAASKKLKRLLADEQNDVLDSLRRSEPVSTLQEIVPDSDEQSTRYADAIADELAEAVASGATTSKSNARPLRKALIAESTDAAVAILDQWLVWPLRDRLERCLADGDGDNAQITKKVRALYREYKTRHIDEQLDDIMRTAHGRGALAGFDVDAPVVWSVDTRHPACPDCDDNALSEPVAAGDAFPTGHIFAPAHPGCRCLLVAAER